MQAQDHNPFCRQTSNALILIALVVSFVSPFAMGQSNLTADLEAFSQARVDALVSSSAQRGDFERGLRVYTQAKSACFSCHGIGLVDRKSVV